MELPQSSIKQENDHSSPAMELNKNYKTEHLGLTKNSIASLMKIKTELHPVDIKIEPCLDVLELKNEDHKLQLSVEDKIIEENNKCVVDCPVLFERENSQENSKVKIESEKISKIEKSDFENWTIDNDELNIKEEEHKSRRKSRDKRRTLVRKYGIRAKRTDVEMEPLPLSDDDEDETVFDLVASRKNIS